MSTVELETPRRGRLRWLAVALCFLGLLGVTVAITAMVISLPAPAAGGTCGQGRGSESAIAAFFNPGSIGAGAEPTSTTAQKDQWLAFVGECQSSTDARMLQASGILLLSLVVGVIGLLMLRDVGWFRPQGEPGADDVASASDWSAASDPPSDRPWDATPRAPSEFPVGEGRPPAEGQPAVEGRTPV